MCITNSLRRKFREGSYLAPLQAGTKHTVTSAIQALHASINELQLPVLCLSNESTNLICSARTRHRLCYCRRKKLCVLSSFTFRPAHLHTGNETLTLTRYELKYITIGANLSTQLQKQAVPLRVTLLTSRHCQWQTLRNSPLLPVRRVLAVISGACCRE
jgi:hypothetical protein